MEQSVVEVDHAANELRREDADAAVVEQIDAARRATFVEHRVVSEMRIAVDHAEAAERKPPGREHRAADAVAVLERRLLVGQKLGAIEPVEREQPAGRELGPHAWHADQVDALQHQPIERDVLCLAPVVELLAHARGDLLGDLGRVDHRVHAAVDREQPVELLQVGFHGRLHVGVLQLAGKLRIIERASAVHLAERRSGRRLVLEGGEFALPVSAQLRHHPPLHERPAHRRRFALQLLQFLDVFGRQQVGDGRHQLGDLHDRAFQPAKRRRQFRGIAPAVEREAQEPARRKARRNAAHIGADARVARGAG